MAYRKMTRIFVESDLAPGVSLRTTAGQAHYLLSVMRMKRGDTLAVFNGRDGEFSARIAEAGHRVCTLEFGERLRPQRAKGNLWLCFALLKRARVDYLVEKATELGVAELHPVITARTIASRANLDRLRANTVEAAEQSERLTVPVLHEPVTLADLIAGWPRGRRLIFCDETGQSPPIADAITGVAGAPCGVLIGPEGGFADSELDLLRRLPFVCAVGLGPRVLRADTAALAALAVVQAVIGDWSATRSR
ncbi:MAG: 16S rRNA (uracil(1498)-N(3))-methyltransferase [Alphaproteobacteria bacterium]|nr:16S rRNA (uracil(1498)-N(3))-methyltransferase [Alphaproteobacteria bacterium]